MKLGPIYGSTTMMLFPAGMLSVTAFAISVLGDGLVMPLTPTQELGRRIAMSEKLLK